MTYEDATALKRQAETDLMYGLASLLTSRCVDAQELHALVQALYAVCDSKSNRTYLKELAEGIANDNGDEVGRW